VAGWLERIRGRVEAGRGAMQNAVVAEGEEPAAGAKDRDQGALDLVVAEFQFVSGLIPFYRGVETTALGGTGLIVSGVVAALAALESADTPKAAAEGILLSAGAWAPVVLLLIEIMALTRVVRASAYIADHLHPLAEEITGRSEVLVWELAPTSHLLKRVRAGRRDSAAKEAIVRDSAVRWWSSSTPVIVTIALVSFLLAVSGAVVYPDALTVVSGVGAILTASAFAAYGTVFSHTHEARMAKPPGPATHPELQPTHPRPNTAQGVRS
jgi:hypothetical protein